MCDFNLIPSIGLSEKEFINKIGREKFEKLYNNLVEHSQLICVGCGFVVDAFASLQLHLNEWNGTDYQTANLAFLCEGCHTLKHFDIAVQKDFVKLCNSSLSQGELINVCRKKELFNNINSGNIFIINSKSPKELLENILDPGFDQNRNSKVKLVFTKNFKWNNIKVTVV